MANDMVLVRLPRRVGEAGRVALYLLDVVLFIRQPYHSLHIIRIVYISDVSTDQSS